LPAASLAAALAALAAAAALPLGTLTTSEPLLEPASPPAGEAS